MKPVAEFPSTLSAVGKGLKNVHLLVSAVKLHLSQDRFSTTTFSMTFVSLGACFNTEIAALHYDEKRAAPLSLILFNEIEASVACSYIRKRDKAPLYSFCIYIFCVCVSEHGESGTGSGILLF